MKITLTLISFLKPVFYTDRSTASGMADGSQSTLFSASQTHQISSNNYSVHITEVYHVKME